MKFHLIVYMLSIAKDLKMFAKNFKSKCKSDFPIYYSELIEKIELSLEMIFDIIYSDKNLKIFEKKKIVLILLEIIRFFFKFKELKSLSKNGINFYVEKNIYLEEVIETTDMEYLSRLDSVKNNNFFNISNKKSSKIFQTTSKIDLPQKVKDALRKEKIEITSDFTTGNLENGNLNGANQISANQPSFSGIVKNLINENLQFLRLMTGKIENFVELLYILRPLLYLILMTLFNKKSFVPFFVNILIDAIILMVKRREEQFENQKIYFQEYKFRVGRLGVYLLREPIFSLITKPFIKKILKVFRFPTLIVDLVLNLLSYYSNIYFIL